MRIRWIAIAAGVLLLAASWAAPASAQVPNYYPYQFQRFFYYPYYYFPHDYWPAMSSPYPERPGEHYRRPPAYMAYPPFRAPNWRYELWQPQRFYHGFHFWLDQIG